MENRQDVIKAFRQARVVGEQMLQSGRITWDQHAFTMIGFEIQLRSMGEDL